MWFADLLQAANNEQITICHDHDSGIPSAPIDVVQQAVCLTVWVEKADDLDAAGQKVAIKVDCVSYNTFVSLQLVRKERAPMTTS